MKTSQTELYSVVAILLYIVFLSHSPPRPLRDLLSNVYIASIVCATFAYITLWQNRTIGVLLILAFILTMTRVTEHLDVPVKPTEPEATPPVAPPTNTPPPPPPPQPSTKPTVDAESVPGMQASTPVVPVDTTPVTVSATTSPSPAQPPPPPPTLPPPPTAPATPPVTATPPAPVMSCNIESFASF